MDVERIVEIQSMQKVKCTEPGDQWDVEYK